MLGDNPGMGPYGASSAEEGIGVSVAGGDSLNAANRAWLESLLATHPRAVVTETEKTQWVLGLTIQTMSYDDVVAIVTARDPAPSRWWLVPAALLAALFAVKVFRSR